MQGEIKRIRQITESHCGPAVLAMLLSFWGKRMSQRRITQAGKLEKKIKKYGSTARDLARALRVIEPGYRLWNKRGAKVNDLDILVNEFKIPVVVEWQGLFYETPEEEQLKGGSRGGGHYSVVHFVDIKEDKIGMADPYKNFYQQDRLFSLKWFEGRWYDYNLIRHRWKKERRLVFFMAPKEMKDFAKLGFEFYR